MTRRTPAGLVLGLLVANVGAAVPFGLDSGGHDNLVDPLEWALSAVFAVAALVLALRLAGLIGQPADRLALIPTAGAWAASAFYAGFLIATFTARARIGFGLIFAGLAVTSAACYILEARR